MSERPCTGRRRRPNLNASGGAGRREPSPIPQGERALRESDRSASDRHLSLIACALLLALTAGVFAPVVRYDFVRFDDPRMVSENPYIAEGFTRESVAWAFRGVRKSNWQPLTWFSHMLDIELHGLNPGPHHATSLFLHVVNALLLFAVLRGMTGRVGRSAVVAALFALHPLHVESVAWISQRKDVLSTPFGLLAIWAYVNHARRGGQAWMAAASAFLAIGLLAKPMLVTLPFVFLLLDHWPLDRIRWRRTGSPDPSPPPPAGAPPLPRHSIGALLAEKAVPFALSAAGSALAVMAQRIGGATRASQLIPLDLRLANAAVSYVRYLGMTVWPSGLAVHYPHPNLPMLGGTPWDAWQILGASAVLVAISSLAVWMRERRYLAVGWLWYLGMLVPVIGVYQVGMQAMADRYTYLPLVGLFIAVTWAAADAAEAAHGRFPPGRALARASALVAVAACAVASSRHLPTWRDSVTLFEQALRVSPTNAIMHNNLANELVARGRLEEGIRHYRRALAIAPGDRKARENLENALRRKAREGDPRQ